MLLHKTRKEERREKVELLCKHLQMNNVVLPPFAIDWFAYERQRIDVPNMISIWDRFIIQGNSVVTQDTTQGKNLRKDINSIYINFYDFLEKGGYLKMNTPIIIQDYLQEIFKEFCIGELGVQPFYFFES